MTATYSPRTGVIKHDHGDEPWEDDMNDNLDTVDSLLAPDRTFYVSPRFTTGNCPALANATDRRHYDTIQGAIDAGEAKAYDNTGYVILASPGVYAENLTVVRSVRIAADGGYGGGFHPGGGVVITGVNTVKSPVLTIDPLESTWNRYEFIGLQMHNLYDQAEGSEIATPPYAVDCLAQTTHGGIQNVVRFKGCNFRMQTWGVSHVWTLGLQFAGFNAVTLEDCQVQGLDYGGGSGSAGIRYLMAVIGYGVGANCDLRFMRDSRLANVFTGSGSHYAFAQSGNSRIEVANGYLSYASQAAALIAGGSNNTDFGLAAGELTIYRNTLGLDLVRML